MRQPASRDNVPGFEIPSPDVSESIIDQFLNTKREATVVLVVDTSGSMQEDNRHGDERDGGLSAAA